MLCKELYLIHFLCLQKCKCSINTLNAIICLITQMQELMVENNDMRETLQNMQTELINLLNQQNDNYESNTEVGKKFILLL